MPNQQRLPIADFMRQLLRRVTDDDVQDLAAGLAYRFLLAIFPFAIFLAALAGFLARGLGLGDPTGMILANVAGNLPPAIADQIGPQLEAVLGSTRPGLLSIGAVGALWAAASGVGSLINAMNKAYEIKETRGFIHRTALALGLTLLGSLGLLVAFVAVVGGTVVSQQMAQSLGLDPAVWSAILLLRLPLMILLVGLAVGVMFKLGPNVGVSFRWALAGGMVFAVGWLVATLLFGLYVANFGQYSNTYGALGGVVVLLLWLYLSGLLLLIAAELTALLQRDREPHVVEARRRETGPHTAPSGSRPAGPATAGAPAHGRTR